MASDGSAPQQCVQVCQYKNCLSNGSAEVLVAFEANAIAGVTVEACGCLGQCNMGPSVRVLPSDHWYCRVKPEDVPFIVEQHLEQGKPVTALLHPRFHPSVFQEG